MYKSGPIYAPPNYQPNSKPEIIIPVSRIKLAKDSGGEFIHKDGDSIYMWRYDALHVAYWGDGSYGAWELWTKEEVPMGELKSL